MADGQVVFEISADPKKAKTAINDTTEALAKAGKKWEASASDSADKMTKSFNKAFDVNRIKGWALQAAKALMDFGKEAVQAASDLEEVQNVVDATFGKDAGRIAAWANSARKQFGLTETQAKRFTSTLGAMAKSAGMAGPEIVQMSTDLSGLAADMASFYNLDFDTAFQKIRSGISGETEPLKQLGINMSVANLQAYALQQGLSKTFDQMSQSEQIMLRYQYLMQATADAQGDFARTSDGYANSLRTLETNLDTLKTSLGSLLVDVALPVISAINGMFDAMDPKNHATVIDDFSNIDLQTAEKIAQIEATATKARELIGILDDIGDPASLKGGLTSFVGALSTQMGNLGAALEAARRGNYSGTIKAIATAMSLETNTSADQWEKLLTAIASKLPGATTAEMSDNERTAAFLNAAAGAAAELGGEYPALWETFLGVLGSNAGAALEALAQASTGIANLQKLAGTAGSVDSTSASNWTGFLNALQGAKGLDGIFGEASTAATTIEQLSNALSGFGSDKQTAAQSLISTLKANAEALSGLTGISVDDTVEWLESLAGAASELEPDDIEGWNEWFAMLIDGLPGLSETEIGKDFLDSLGKLGTAAGKIAPSTASNWEKFLDALNKTDGLSGVFGGASTAASTIASFSSALSGVGPEKANAWNELLSTLSEHADGLTALTGKGVEETQEWLSDLAKTANSLDPDSPDGWDELFTALVDGLPGLSETPVGEQFLNSLTRFGTAAESITPDTAKNWTDLLHALNSAGSMTGIFGDAEKASGYIESLSNALSGTGTEKAEAWNRLLESLALHADSLSELTGKSADETWAWLEGLKETANGLDPDSPEGWSELFTAFIIGLPGLSETTLGEQFLTNIGALSNAANGLKTDSVQRWQSLLNILNTSGSLSGIFGESASIKDFAEALGGVGPEKTKAWNDLLFVLSEHADQLSELTGKDAEGTKEWLDTLSEGVNSLDPDKADGWDKLFGTFVGGLSGLTETEEGRSFIVDLMSQYAQLGQTSDLAASYLRALGIETGDVDNAQNLWLQTCRELVKTIPGLSDIVDVNTGAVEGGAKALYQYVDAWKQLQTRDVLMAAIDAKDRLLDPLREELNALDTEILLAQARYNLREEGLNRNRYGSLVGKGNTATKEEKAEREELKRLFEDQEQAAREIEELKNRRKELNDQLIEGEKILAENRAAVEAATAAADGFTEATSTLAITQEEAAQRIADTADALKSVADYYDSAREATMRNINATISGFKPTQTARDDLQDLRDELKRTGNEELKLRIADAENAIPTIENMTAALQDQLAWMQEYQQNLALAQAAGVNADLLASLSDGSVESAEYLAAIAQAAQRASSTGNTQDIDNLNAAYEAVQSGKENFADALTNQTLIADAAFQSLLDTANRTVEELDMADGAKDAMTATVQGIAQAIADQIPDVNNQIDALMAALNRLNTISGIGYGGGTYIHIDGSNANGLDYVPFDGYLSQLHEGESVLTAEEARIWRDFKAGGASTRNAIDYGALSGAIWDSAPNMGGGNVYLNGQVVGRVISAQQADNLRTLERSGWQG